MYSSAGEGKPAEIASFTNGLNSVDGTSCAEEYELFESIEPTSIRSI